MYNILFYLFILIICLVRISKTTHTTHDAKDVVVDSVDVHVSSNEPAVAINCALSILH